MFWQLTVGLCIPPCWWVGRGGSRYAARRPQHVDHGKLKELGVAGIAVHSAWHVHGCSLIFFDIDWDMTFHTQIIQLNFLAYSSSFFLRSKGKQIMCRRWRSASPGTGFWSRLGAFPSLTFPGDSLQGSLSQISSIFSIHLGWNNSQCDHEFSCVKFSKLCSKESGHSPWSPCSSFQLSAVHRSMIHRFTFAATLVCPRAPPTFRGASSNHWSAGHSQIIRKLDQWTYPKDQITEAMTHVRDCLQDELGESKHNI